MTNDGFDGQMIATANSVKDRIRRRGEATGEPEPAGKMTGAMVGTLNKFLGGNDLRKIVLAWLFAGDFEVLSPMSSKLLVSAQKWAIIEWIAWWRDDEEAWHVGDRFPHEAICVMNAAIRAYNSANRTDKMEVASDMMYSLTANMVELGGVVTAVTDEAGSLTDALSKIDKKEDNSDE